MLDAERALASEMRVGISEKHQVFVEVCVGDGVLGGRWICFCYMYPASVVTD